MAKKTTPKAASSSPVHGVDLPEIEKLLDFMRKHGLEEFQYERRGFRIRLKKPWWRTKEFTTDHAPEIGVGSAPAHASHASPSASAAARAAAQHAPAADTTRHEDLHIV